MYEFVGCERSGRRGNKSYVFVDVSAIRLRLKRPIHMILYFTVK